MSEIGSYNVPGGFPQVLSPIQPVNTNNNDMIITSTPPKSSSNGIVTTPSSACFKFTPTHGRRLYPNVRSPGDNTILSDQDCDMSYQDKENASFTNEMDHLQQRLFSSKLSTNVLNEFNDRYQQVRTENLANITKLNNNTSNSELNRRASGRYGTNHKVRFNRMESIATHYAARRSALPTKISPERKILEREATLNNAKADTPGDKRGVLHDLGSASKRMKIIGGKFKEMSTLESPTRSNELKTVMELKLSKLPALINDNLTPTNTLIPPPTPNFYTKPQQQQTQPPQPKSGLIKKSSTTALDQNFHQQSQSQSQQPTLRSRESNGALNQRYHQQSKPSTNTTLASSSTTTSTVSRSSTQSALPRLSTLQSSLTRSITQSSIPRSSTQSKFPSYALPTKSSISRSEPANTVNRNLTVTPHTALEHSTESKPGNRQSSISPSRGNLNLHSLLSSSSSTTSSANAEKPNMIRQKKNTSSLYPSLNTTKPNPPTLSTASRETRDTLYNPKTRVSRSTTSSTLNASAKPSVGINRSTTTTSNLSPGTMSRSTTGSNLSRLAKQRESGIGVNESTSTSRSDRYARPWRC